MPSTTRLRKPGSTSQQRRTNNWRGSAKPDRFARFPLLISYAYLRSMKPDDIHKFVTNPNVELLLDSGAFTALNAGKEIDLAEYMEFLQQYKDYLFGYFALDKLGDADTTRRNLKTMLKAGLKPVPIHVRGATEKDMNELFRHSDWVGLGGFRRPHRGPAQKDYVKQKMLWANGRNVHWLGYTNRDMVAAFKPYSVDCSSWNMALRYGGMRMYYGRGVWGKKTVHCRDFQAGVYPTKALRIIERCGFTLDQAKDEKCWRSNRAEEDVNFLPLHVSIHCWIRFIRDVRTTIGTRFFMACASISHLHEIYKQIDATAPKGATK